MISYEKLLNFIKISHFIGIGYTSLYLNFLKIIQSKFPNLKPNTHRDVSRRLVAIINGFATGISGLNMFKNSLENKEIGSWYEKLAQSLIPFVIYDFLRCILDKENHGDLLLHHWGALLWHGIPLITEEKRDLPGFITVITFSDVALHSYTILKKLKFFQNRKGLQKLFFEIQFFSYIFFRFFYFFGVCFLVISDWIKKEKLFLPDTSLHILGTVGTFGLSLTWTKLLLISRQKIYQMKN